MTIVDARGKRAPAQLKGRTFSGPPAGSRRGGAGVGASPAADRRRGDDGGQPGDAPRGSLDTTVDGQRRGGATTRPASSRRPGALLVWSLGLAGTAVGLAYGASQHDAIGAAPLTAFAVAAPICAGLVRRGSSLRRLVMRLPLVLVLVVYAGSVVFLRQTHSPATAKAALLQTIQTLVLHSPYLWIGMALAVLVASRRGLFRR